VNPPMTMYDANGAHTGSFSRCANPTMAGT
jgi:hypothetical protein